jgi:hypothetical protein
MDIVGPLPITENGNRYILTMIDHFSRYGWAEPIANKDSKNVCRCLSKWLKNEEKKPEMILTDNGCEFVNNDFKTFAEDNHILTRRGSLYHPQTTGAVERFNQTLMRKLRKLCCFGRMQWDQFIEKAVYGYNISYCRPIGLSPHEFKYLKMPMLSIDVEMGSKASDLIIPEREIFEFKETIKDYEKSYGIKNLVNKFTIGDKVWYYDPVCKKNKLDTQWTGVGTIKSCAFKSYVIVDEDGREIRANEMYLKKFECLD